MEDILGRQINDGDIVVCMAIGKYSSGMHFGISVGDKGAVRTLDGVKHPRNQFLVSNPTEDELKIIEEIKEKYRKQNEERMNLANKRKNTKALPYRSLKFGYVYEDDSGNEFVFLGKCKMSITYKNYNQTNCIGYIYIPITSYYDYTKYITEHPAYMNRYSRVNPFKVLQSRKKLVKEKYKHEELSKLIIDNNKISAQFDLSETRTLSYYAKSGSILIERLD